MCENRAPKKKQLEPLERERKQPLVMDRGRNSGLELSASGNSLEFSSIEIRCRSDRISPDERELSPNSCCSRPYACCQYHLVGSASTTRYKKEETLSNCNERQIELASLKVIQRSKTRPIVKMKMKSNSGVNASFRRNLGATPSPSLIGSILAISVCCLISLPRCIVYCSDELESVQSPVRITIQPNDLIAIEGESAELNCDAEGRPEPTIEWYHNGQLIKSSTNSRTTMGGSIQFLDIRPNIFSPSLSSSSAAKQNRHQQQQQQQQQQSDAGVYHCVAKNQFGEARSRNATLQVACKYKLSIIPTSIM